MGQYIPAPIGETSPGVAPGGLKNQYLRKASDLDYDTDWEDIVITGEGGGAGTNLGYTASTRLLTSSTGTDVTLPLADGTNAGLMANSDKTKLDGIASGATANSSDATLLNRANHTGTQAAGTITGLATVATSGAYNDLSGRPTLGSAAAANTGTSAGNVVQLDGSGKLPAVDGSALTGLPAGATNLGYTASTRLLTSSTGTDVTLPLATTAEAGLMAASDKAKVDSAASIALSAALAIALG